MEQEVKKEKLPQKYKIAGYAVVLPIGILCGLIFVFFGLLWIWAVTLFIITLLTYFGDIGQWLLSHRVQNKTVLNYIVPMGLITFLKIIPHIVITTYGLMVCGIFKEYIPNHVLVDLSSFLCAIIFMAMAVFILFNDYRRYYRKLKNNKMEQ